jgi:hypothetical protein
MWSEQFIFKLNESTGITRKLVIQLAFVWYVYEGEFQEDLLLCKSVLSQTTFFRF